MNATKAAIKLLKNPGAASDGALIMAVRQVLGYSVYTALEGQNLYSSTDLRTDIKDFASLLK